MLFFVCSCIYVYVYIWHVNPYDCVNENVCISMNWEYLPLFILQTQIKHKMIVGRIIQKWRLKRYVYSRNLMLADFRCDLTRSKCLWIYMYVCLYVSLYYLFLSWCTIKKNKENSNYNEDKMKKMKLLKRGKMRNWVIRTRRRCE